MPPQSTRELFMFRALVTVAADTRPEAVEKLEREFATLDARGEVQIAILGNYPAISPAASKPRASTR